MGYSKTFPRNHSKKQKIKTLQQTVRRQTKRISNMETILKDLQNQNLINEDSSNILLESFGKNQDLITNWSKKI